MFYGLSWRVALVECKSKSNLLVALCQNVRVRHMKLQTVLCHGVFYYITVVYSQVTVFTKRTKSYYYPIPLLSTYLR